MVQLDQKAPEIHLIADDGSDFTLSERTGSRVLLVFYPGDNTPVCTRQLCEYRDGIEQFSELGVTVVGVSPDGHESHLAFRNRYDLPFTLLSDEDLEVARRYGCKGLLGMKRGVFLVDEAGVIRYAHVEALALFRRSAGELLDVIQQLGQLPNM